MAYAARVAATFAVSWRLRDRQTCGNTEDHARRDDGHALRVAEPFRAGRGKLRVPAVDHFMRALITVATAIRERVSRGVATWTRTSASSGRTATVLGRECCFGPPAVEW